MGFLAASFNQKSWKAVLVALLIIVVVAAGVVGYQFKDRILSIVGSHGTSTQFVEFSDTGVPVWYRVGFSGLAAAKDPNAPQGLSVTILESVPFNANGDVAVLAQVPNQKGTVLGIVHGGKTFESIVADGTYKTDLAVRSDGQAMFASASSTSSTIILGHGTTSDLITLNLLSKKHPTQDLGLGRSPRVEPDGSFLALTPKGLVSFNPGTSDPKVIVTRTNADNIGAAISQDGSVVALPDDQQEITFYSVRSVGGTQIVSVLGSLQETAFVSQAAFLDNQHFITFSSISSGFSAFITIVPKGGTVAPISTSKLSVTTSPN
jgi:hypothetical protein